MSCLVSLDNVTKSFPRGGTTVRAVDSVCLTVDAGEIVGVIGESGSGKSTLARLVLGLYGCDSGTVTFAGEDLGVKSQKELRRTRSRMGMVFQEPLESLNPRLRVQAIVEEPLVVHSSHIGKKERHRRVVEALDAVSLDESYLRRSPRQLSGGQQQRVSVARAIISRPELLVLDEPTSALDLSVQAQLLMLLRRLRDEFNLSYLFISHDIDCVRFMSHKVAVMYLGKVVEFGPVDGVLSRPLHPYTQRLLASSLSIDPRQKPKPVVPNPFAADRTIPLRECLPGHWVALESEESTL